MALTDAQKEWLTEDNEKIILCDIEYHDGDSLKLAHFSNSNYIMQASDSFVWTWGSSDVPADVNPDGITSTISNVAYVDNLINIPTINSKITADINIGTLEFLNAEGDYDSYINWAWEGHLVRVLIGDPSWVHDDFILVLEGINSNITSTRRDVLALNIKDKKEVFNAKIQTNTIFWNAEQDNHPYNLYQEFKSNDPVNNPGQQDAFIKPLNNLFNYSTGIPININSNTTTAELAQILYNVLISRPEFDTSVALSGTTFTITCTSFGDAEDAHDDDTYPTGISITPSNGSASTYETIAFNTSTANTDLGGAVIHVHSPTKRYYFWFNVDNGNVEPIIEENFTLGFEGTYVNKTWIPDTIINTPVPILLGKCFNVEPRLIDSYNHIYQVHDGPIESIDEVRSNGVVLEKNVQWEENKHIGCFRLLVHENNTRITCDVTGTTTRGKDSNDKSADADIATHSAAWLIEWIALERSSLLAADLCPVRFDQNTGLSNTAVMGLYITEETDIAPIVTDIMSSIGGYARFGRTCILQLYQLEDPKDWTDIIDLELDADNILEDGVALGNTEPPKSSILLGYCKNWAVQDKGTLAGILTSSEDDESVNLVSKYSTEFSTVSNYNANIKLQYPLAEDTELLPSFIREEDAAQTEVNRRVLLRKQKRFVYNIKTTTAPFTISLGDVILVTTDRFGFNSGRKALVVGMQEYPTKQRVDLEVWL
jgi:hypothetical protein